MSEQKRSKSANLSQGRCNPNPNPNPNTDFNATWSGITTKIWSVLASQRFFSYFFFFLFGSCGRL